MCPGADRVGGNFHFGDLGHIGDIDFDGVAGSLARGSQVGVGGVVLIEVHFIGHRRVGGDGDCVPLLEEGVFRCQIDPVEGNTRNFIGADCDNREFHVTTLTDGRIGSRKGKDWSSIHADIETGRTPNAASGKLGNAGNHINVVRIGRSLNIDQ